MHVHVHAWLTLPGEQNVRATGQGGVSGSFGAFDVFIV